MGDPGTTSDEHLTACPRNCYSTCALRVQVEDGQVRRVLPEPGNVTTAEGPCIKGLSYVERVASPDRLLHPLRRTARGSFARVTWNEALAEVADRLTALREDPGPQSVLFYAASGTKGLMNAVGPAFFRMYGGSTTTYGDLCWPAGLEATRLTLGENKHNHPGDLVHARLIILWGKNSAETNLHQMTFVAQAQRDGARLIVIDPRRTPSAERADLLLQPRPGSDGALALALAHCLIRDHRCDDDFVRAHVHGFDEFAATVGDCSPIWAAPITGLDAGHIEDLAEALGTIAPATICAGFGMQRYTNSGQTMRAMIALLALTGNLGKPGAGWQFANLQTAIFDEVKDPVAFYPPAVPDGVARVSISTARLGQDMLETHDPPLRMAWVERGNPLAQNPDTATVRRAFDALDFRVVVDQFLTDTARAADLVLPAKSFLEQTDVIGAYWHPYVQLKPKVIEPPGEVKPESEIYRALARLLELDPVAVDAAIPGPTDADVQRWLEQRLEPWPALSLEGLRSAPALAPGHQAVAFEDRVFLTPSGKIELLSADAATRWGIDPLPTYHAPVESALADPPSRYPLQLLTPNTKNRIHSQFGNLETIRARDPGPDVALSLADARARGIQTGDAVRVFNDRGAVEVPARIDHGLRPGCVVITNGWWATEGCAVNVTSQGRETDVGHGAAFHDNLVEIEKT